MCAFELHSARDARQCEKANQPSPSPSVRGFNANLVCGAVITVSLCLSLSTNAF